MLQNMRWNVHQRRTTFGDEGWRKFCSAPVGQIKCAALGIEDRPGPYLDAARKVNIFTAQEMCAGHNHGFAGVGAQNREVFCDGGALVSQKVPGSIDEGFVRGLALNFVEDGFEGTGFGELGHIQLGGQQRGEVNPDDRTL